MFRFLAPYRKESVLAPLFKMAEASFELCVPLFVAAMIDKGITPRDTGEIVKYALLLVLLAALGLVFAVTAQYFSAKAAVGCASGVRTALFAHIRALSRAETDTIGISALVTRMTGDVNQVQTGVNMTLRLLLRSPFVVFGAVIMAFIVDVRTALWFAVLVPLLFIVVFAVLLKSLPLYGKVQQAAEKLFAVTRENLTGVRVIRAFAAEEAQAARFDGRNAALERLQKTVGRVAALLDPLTFVPVNLAVAGLLYTGALSVDAGTLSRGALIAQYNYMSQILVELVKLASLILTVTKAVASAKRIESVLETAPSLTEGTVEPSEAGAAEAVRFSHVSFAYRGAGAEALTDISFAARPGETVGIIGGTGSGKSTLVSLISRVYDATAGEVSLFGVNVKDVTAAYLRDAVAVVPQKAALFAGTVRDNLTLRDAGATDEELWQALKNAQADGIVRDKGGLDAEVEQNGRNFSGGQKQRLTVARALVGRPRVLILDDSASALDYATDAALRAAIAALPFHPTVFVVSQRASGVMKADKVIVLEDGKAVGIGRHEDLLENCGVYREIYDSQFADEGGAR